MPRSYQRLLGSRSYANYSEETVEKALKSVIDDGMSLKGAARTFKIPYGTLSNRYHGRHGLKRGGQAVLSEKEEEAIVKAITTSADWGFPLTQLDLQLFIKSYLDAQGRPVCKFKNNMPGKDWVQCFVDRHKDLSKRWASNISASRSKVSKQGVMKFFNNLKDTIAGVPDTNLFNYDETNMSDNPGKKLCLYRRGTKYPEKVMNHSKSATSVMIAGSASGTLLPPYVIYKADNLWDTWRQNGPKGHPCCDCRPCQSGSRYNRTKSGWIDMATFLEWFKKVFLPHVKELPGKKVLLGDNLSSHFCPEVLRLCEENDVAFVCLPPNSTHICQPLDVAFFRPMKESWRQVLSSFKASHLKTTGLPKDVFPSLLKRALEAMDQKETPVKKKKDDSGAISHNLRSGFAACGIFPYDPERVMKKLHTSEAASDDVQQQVSSSLVEFLKEKRFGNSLSISRKRKRTKLPVSPGKSVAYVDSESESGSDRSQKSDEESKEDSSVEEEEEEQKEDVKEVKKGEFLKCSVTYDKGTKKETRKFFVGQSVEDSDGGEVLVSFMRPSTKVQGNYFFPLTKDEMLVPITDVIKILKVKANRRGIIKF